MIVKHPDAIIRYTRMLAEASSIGRYGPGTRSHYEVVMGDKYVGQAGIMGHVHARDILITQTWNRLENKIDLIQLAQELQQLREAMEREGSEPAHKLAIGAVGAAEQSARQKDGPKVIDYLRASGNWAL